MFAKLVCVIITRIIIIIIIIIIRHLYSAIMQLRDIRGAEERDEGRTEEE